MQPIFEFLTTVSIFCCLLTVYDSVKEIQEQPLTEELRSLYFEGRRLELEQMGVEAERLQHQKAQLEESNNEKKMLRLMFKWYEKNKYVTGTARAAGAT